MQAGATAAIALHAIEDSPPAAAYLSVSAPQVYSLVRSGELPAIKIGGRGVWRVDRAKLDAYLEQLEKETAAWAKAHPLNPRDRGVPEEDFE